MTTLGLIGSGNIGGTLARLAVQAGVEVVLSNSRGPDTLRDLVDELGDRARADTAANAGAAGDIVVVTVPLRNYRQVPVEPLRGKTVIDTNNYYPDRDGHFAELDDESTTTSELLAAHLPESQVVKGFNNIVFSHLATLGHPAGSSDRSALPIAGNDARAKEQATSLIDELGYDVADAGPLAEGWRFQRDTAAYVMPYAADPDNPFGPGKPADAAKVRDALARAQRYADMS